jgi:hypothetical protein
MTDKADRSAIEIGFIARQISNIATKIDVIAKCILISL